MQDMELMLWITLLSTPGIGLKTARRVMSAAQDWGDLVVYQTADWCEHGLSLEIAKNLRESFLNKVGEYAVERLRRESIQVVGANDEHYPRLLHEIDDPPPFLTYLGDGVTQYDTIVAVVGTRQCTAYGRRAAREIAQDLQRDGVIIASGLAMGIDQEAHKATLQNGGKTIAVLGSGLYQVYPAQHRPLADQIAATGGTVYSEFLPWQGPQRHHFIQRNRLISGMSKAVIVVEAGTKSGALITADYALSQNRDVAVVPGSIYNSHAQGCHELLVQGAMALISTKYVLQQLQITVQNCTLHHDTLLTSSPIGETKEMQDILAQLQVGYKSMGDLSRSPELVHLSLSEMTKVLTEMEVHGLIVRVGPGLYGL